MLCGGAPLDIAGFDVAHAETVRQHRRGQITERVYQITHGIARIARKAVLFQGRDPGGIVFENPVGRDGGVPTFAR